MRYRINHPRVIHETIDGEVVAIDLATGNYYSLAHGAAIVWSGVEKGSDAPGIVSLVQARMEGNAPTLEGDVHELLEQLVKEELVMLEPSEKAVPVSVESNGEARLPYLAPMLEKFDDMQDLILLDPVHDIDIAIGWPQREAT